MSLLNNPSLLIIPLKTHHVKNQTLYTTTTLKLPYTDKPNPKTSLSTMWREIQGSSNWKNLLDPQPHPLLQSELIRYAQLVSACYKAFNLYLNYKYDEKSMFRQLGIDDPGYDVTKYIYSTTPNNCSRWIGYVAVSTDDQVKKLGRRDILVAFRGTITKAEWIANLMSSLTPPRFNPSNPQCEVKVESGFLTLYTCSDNTHGSCRDQVLKELVRIIDSYKSSGEKLSITLGGHSMGSSLAILLGYDLAELGLNGEVPITVYSFGGPRVGNLGFKRRLEEVGVKVLRVVNVNDPVTKMPGVLLNSDGKFCRDDWYAHVGVEVGLDFFKVGNPTWVHDMEGYINGFEVGNVKCRKVVELDETGGDDGAERVGEMVMMSIGHKFDTWGWKMAARVCELTRALTCI